jgi:hypothetical protein
MFITEAMVSRELIIEDHMSEFKRIPLKYLPEEIGKVSTARTPPDCQPFEGQSDDVYPLDPTSFFEAADEVVNATPLGEEIHFDLIVETKEQ